MAISMDEYTQAGPCGVARYVERMLQAGALPVPQKDSTS
jgi:hypothetical protein